MTSSRRYRSLIIAALPALLVACKTANDGDAAQLSGGPAPTPSVSLSANPLAVAAGEMSTLTWSSANADACAASGSWSGERPASGNENVGPLAQDSQFTLTCSGEGGSASQSVTVTVNSGNNSPTLNFTSTAGVVPQGGSATLNWNSTNADSCMASGDWSGARSTSGSEVTGGLTDNATFTLTCNGPGGSVSRTVSVTVTPVEQSAVSGSVDSSLINRSGQNRIYVFAGAVSPDDFDGDGGDPLFSATVMQDSGTCTFSYDLGTLAAGDYTVAFTGDAASDDPQANDTIDFYGAQTVSVGASGAIADFEAARVIRVGPGRPYQTVAAAAAAAQDGDVVEIEAGVYSADVAAWYQNNLTLRGVGGFAHLRADGADSQGKAIWVIAGNNVVVENIEFSDVTVPDQNGAGIRADGRNLVVCNGYFHDSDEGILGGAGDVLIEYSEFDNNGYGDGFSHNMYILDAERFTLRYSYVHHARIGHNVKSRARENHILYNRIMDEVSGSASYAIDLPNGGLSFVIGNLLQQGPNTDNSAIVSYGTEGLPGGRTHNLFMINNTLVDDYGGRFIQANGSASLIRVVNNLLVGSGTVLSGASGDLQGNLQTTAPGLVNIDAFDYRLTAASPARDAGIEPGQGNGLNLKPVYQYLHVSDRELRPSDGKLDVGAYEYVP